MDLEEVYMVLFGASNSTGVKYDVLTKWFRQCGIIDGRFISEELFTRSYERICPNREDLSQTQFIQLLGILARETRTDVRVLVKKFDSVKEIIIQEVVESRMNDEYT